MISFSSLLWFLLLSSSPLIINPIINIGIVDAQTSSTSYYQHEIFLQSLRVQVNSTSSSSSFIDLGNETLSISALVDVLVFGSGDVVSSSSSSNNNNNNNNKLNVFKSAPNSVFVVTRNNLATTTATTMNSNSFLQNNYYGYQQPGQVPQIFSSAPRIQYFSTSTKESWVISSSGSTTTTTSSGVSLDLTSGTSTNPINTIKVNLSSPSLVDTYYNAFERYVSMILNNKNNTLFKYYCGSSSSLYKCCQDPTNVSNIIAYYLDYNFSDPIMCTRNTFSTTSSSPLVSVGVPINLDFSMITPSSSSSGSRQKQFSLNSTSLFDSLTTTNQQSSSSSSSPPSIALLDYADQTRKEQVSIKILLNDKYSTTTTTTAQQTLDSIYSSIVDATSPTLNKRFCFHQFPDATLPSSSLLLSSFMAPNTTVFGSTRNHLGYFADTFARTDKQCDQPGVFYTAIYSPPSNVVDPLNQLAAIFDRYSIANNIKNNDLFLASSYDQTTSIDLIQSNYVNSDNKNNNNLMLLNSMDFAFSDPAEKRNIEIQVDAVFQMGSEILKRLFPVNVISDSSFFGYFSSSEITGINRPTSSSTARTSMTFTTQKFTFDLNLTFCVDISNRAGVTSPSGSLIFSIQNLDCDSSSLFVATESKNDSFSLNHKNNNNSATSASSLIRSSISCSNFRFSSSSSSSSSSFTTISPIDRPAIPVFKTQKFCISGAQIQIDFEFQINISSSSSTELPLTISDLQSIKNQIYQKYFNNSDDDDNVSFHRMISGSAVVEVQDLAGKIIIDVPMNWSYDFVPQKIKSTEFKNKINEFLRTSSSSLDENSFLTSSFVGEDIFVKTRMKDNNATPTTFFFDMSSSNLISFVQNQYCPYLQEQQNYFSDAASRVGKLVQQMTSSSSICLINNNNNSNFSTQANTTISNLLISDSVCKLIFGDSSFLISESSSSSLFLPTCQPPRSLKIINPANFTPQNLLDFYSESDGVKTNNNNNTAVASEEIFDELIDIAIEHRLQDRCSSDFASLSVASSSALVFHISSPSPSVVTFVKTQQSRVLYNASKVESEVNDKTLFLHQLNLTRLIVEVENRQREIDAEREIQMQKIRARHITVACFVSLDVILIVTIICFFIVSKSKKLQKFFGIERWFSRNLGKNSNCDGNQRENSEISNSDNGSTSSEAEVASSPFNNNNLFHHHARVRRHRSSSNYKNRDIASSPVGFNNGIEFERSPSPTTIEIASSSPFQRISESNHFPSSEMNNNRKTSHHNQNIHDDRTHVSSRSKSSPPSKNIIAQHQSSTRSVSRSNNNKNNNNFNNNNNETHPLFTNIMNHHQQHPHRSSSRNQSNNDHSQGDNFIVSVIPRAFEQSIGAETDLAMFSNTGFNNRGNNVVKNHNSHKRSSSCASNNNNNINNNSSSSLIYQQNNQNTEHRASRSGSVTSAVAAKSTVTHDSSAASFFPTQSFSRRPSCANPSCPPQQRNDSQERHIGRDSRNNDDDIAVTAGTAIGKSISRRMSSSNAGWSDYSPEILHQTHVLNKQEASQFNQGLHHHSQSRHDEEFYYFTQQQQKQSQNDDDCCNSKNQKYRASSNDGNRCGKTMISNQNAAATAVPSSSFKNEQNCDSSKRKRSSIVRNSNNNNISNSDRSSSNNSSFSATTRTRRRTSSNNNGSRTNSSSSAQDDAQQHQDLYFGDEVNNKKMRKPSTKMNNRNNNNNNDQNKDFSFSVG